MNSRWGDEVDEELLKRERVHASVMSTVNFISMHRMLQKFDEEVGEVDEHYPKDEINKMWMGCLGVMFVLMLFTYNAIMIATLPFLFFYFFQLFGIYKTLKRFQYDTKTYWLKTIVLLVVLLAASFLLRKVLFTYVF